MRAAKKSRVYSPPGSEAALDRGCRCPVLDNYHGKGFPYGRKTFYWINENCPMHGVEADDRLDK